MEALPLKYSHSLGLEVLPHPPYSLDYPVTFIFFAE